MQGSTVMRQSSAEALVTEEPYALIAHVRVCGGGRVGNHRLYPEGWHHAAKASRSEDLDIEEPVACWYASAFHFHTTLPGILGSMRIRDEIIQMREPCEKRLLASPWMMEAFHRE